MVKNPLLNYHGGKWTIAPKIVSLFPPHHTYVEPFGGGGGVLLFKERSHTEVYNDLDDDIVNLFYVIRDKKQDLTEKIRLTPYARKELENAFEKTDEPIEKARRLLIRSMMGRSPGSVNINTGRTSFRNKQMQSRQMMAEVWMKYPNRIGELCKRLQGVVIENKDAFDLIKQFDAEDTLFYVDPPYMFQTRDAGTDYKYELTDSEHKKLAELLNSVSGKVVLSGYASEEYKDWYSGWRVKEIDSYADGGGKRIEVLWLNFEEFSMF
jgi:DNA adenine methylase